MVPQALLSPLEKPFRAIRDKEHLQDRPVQDVYKILIKSCRLRMENSQEWYARIGPDGVYSTATTDGL
jgi:hypothetical protein